jgi:hypothetical protein
LWVMRLIPVSYSNGAGIASCAPQPMVRLPPPEHQSGATWRQTFQRRRFDSILRSPPFPEPAFCGYMERRRCDHPTSYAMTGNSYSVAILVSTGSVPSCSISGRHVRK